MLIEEQNGNFAKPVLPAVPLSEVYLEDCVTALKRYADNHFDLAIVDPPYGIGAGADARQGIKFNKSATRRKDYGSKDWDSETPSDEYFEELIRVSKNQIVWGVNYYPNNLLSGGRIFWDKDTAEDYTNSDGELAFCSMINSIKKVKIRWNGMLQHDMKNKELRIHPTQKPVKLYDWLLSKFAKPNDLILDTHLGSGSSRIAAYKGGFNFVGFEIDQEYYEKQEKRFNDFKSQLRLF
jgi:site-specific DNA-methyltransferase (adenine-specific)